MEVGPLSRVLVMYAKGDAATRELVDSTLATLGVEKRALFSTLGRTAARTLESKLIADKMQEWYDDLVANIRAGDTRTFNEKSWSHRAGPARPRALASWRRREADWPITW